MPTDGAVTGIRALVVDNDAHAAAQVRAMLARDGAIVRIAASAAAAMALAGEYPPDVLVLDIDLGCDHGGIDLAIAMRRRWRAAIVFVARHLSPSAIDAIAAIDSAEIVSKPIDGRQLTAALRLAIQRHAAAARPVTHGTDAGEAEWLGRLAVLRPREREVARLLLRNRVPAIAEQLGISAHTVRNHLKGAFRRTGTSSQQDLLDWLRHSGEPLPGVTTDIAQSGYLATQPGVDYHLASDSVVDGPVGDAKQRGV